MRFTERKEFLYDPEVFGLYDTQTALKIYTEFVVKYGPVPQPVFLEVDRRDQKFDPLWHTPVGPRTMFSREFAMPVVNRFEKPKFKRTRFGVQPKKVDYFLMAHNILSQVDYFPLHGDQIIWNGYRYTIVDIMMDPECYWHQTNVWMGLYVVAVVPPDGDAKPVLNPAVRVPAEKSAISEPAPH